MDVTRAARVLWDYHHLGRPVESADVILGLGSYDLRVAEHSAALFLEGRAPWLVFSGGVGQPPERTGARWDAVEVEVFRRVALERGVPAERILAETRSTNTGENFRFTEALLHGQGIPAERVRVVCKPFMERRAVATGQAQTRWPRIAATSPPERWEAFCARFDPAYVISDMVGGLRRILLYPALGHQTPQEVPPGVLAAYRLLVEAGYRARLIPGAPPWPAADGPAPPPGR